MLEFNKPGMAPTTESRMNMEKLSKPELLMLFSVLEGELEARELVIEALRAQRRDSYVRQRYGKFDLSDPFLALQRDSEALRGGGGGHEAAACSDPLAVLKLVVAHCRRMQEKMLAQLAAAESRHRRVIADLEEEKRRHAEDTAEGDDVTYLLEKERERLLQQCEFERTQVRRMEKDQKRQREQQEEDRQQHHQLAAALAKECQRAGARAQEEAQCVAELVRRLDRERAGAQALRQELEEERRRALQTEARAEEQLAEFDTEREQLRARLKKEEARCCELREEVEELRRGGEGEEEEAQPRMNGHHAAKEGEAAAERPSQENGGDGRAPLPPSSPVSSSLTSPCSSPVLQRQANAPSLQASYQAGIHQRFHAARHKFQGHPDQEPPAPPSPQSPRDLSPCATPPPPEHGSPAQQVARSTVTQALSRFAVAQQGGAKPAAANSSPFGTDYRALAPPGSPSAGVRSPTIPRAERGIPPPIPPKKPGLAQAPASPAPVPRAGHFPELSASCGLASGQEGVKELDVVLSSSG